MNPEVILEYQPDIESLLDAMHRFASRLLMSDQRQGAVVGRRFSSHLGVAYGLSDSVELALQLREFAVDRA